MVSLTLRLKSLEATKARVEKRDRRYPQAWLGAAGNGGPGIMFQMPLPGEARK